MSLWTPGGEHPTDPERAGGGAGPEPDLSSFDTSNLSAEEQEKLEAMQEQMAEVRQQLLSAPAAVVIANHAMGLYELAAIHLTAESPKLQEAVLAVDALNALVTSLEGRLGEAESTLREALSQLRAAYLEVKGRSGGSDADGAT